MVRDLEMKTSEKCILHELTHKTLSIVFFLILSKSLLDRVQAVYVLLAVR